MVKRKLTKDYIIQCMERGMFCSDIVKETGLNCSSVYAFCVRNNIEFKRKKCGGHNVKDITGQRYGSLTVVSRNYGKSDSKLAHWNCLCCCGQMAVCKGSDLRQGKIKTCGCRIGIRRIGNFQGYGYIPKGYWRSLIDNAERRGILVQLTIKEADELFVAQKYLCALSGVAISFSERTASLDRIDNSKGYVSENVQWVHKDINRIKQSFAQERFIELCCNVADEQRSKKCQVQRKS